VDKRAMTRFMASWLEYCWLMADIQVEILKYQSLLRREFYK
jgi:hypothetical protein